MCSKSGHLIWSYFPCTVDKAYFVRWLWWVAAADDGRRRSGLGDQAAMPTLGATKRFQAKTAKIATAAITPMVLMLGMCCFQFGGWRSG